MFSTFRDLSSPLGVAALRAQDPHFCPPPADAQLTGRQWIDRYLEPLSQSDLLADHLVCGATVVGVSRPHFTKTRTCGDHQRDRDGFCLLVEHGDGRQTWQTADIVIDATGVYGRPNGCGPGGLPARGETALQSRIEYGIPDVLGAERCDYASRGILVLGSGLAAAATIVNLATLIDAAPQTQVTWITRQTPAAPTSGPICLAHHETLLARKRLAEAANRLAGANKPNLLHRPGAVVDTIDFDDTQDEFLVTCLSNPLPARFDRIVANVGYRGDHSLHAELHVRLCERTERPWGICQSGTATPGSAADREPDGLITTEPHFYLLGAKSHGRSSSFLMSSGFRQIRDLFTVIGGRAGLDLYASAERLACGDE
jgi:hypothetical protein